MTKVGNFELNTMVRGVSLGLALALGACSDSDALTSSGLAGPGKITLAVEPQNRLNSALGDYLAGNFALDRGQLADAAAYFERALAADPNNLELLRQLYLLNLASGDYDAALAQARRMVELDPNEDEAHLLLALEQARAGEFGATRTQLEALGERGIAALALPFLDAWSMFGRSGADAIARAQARLEEGEPLGPLNGYHSAMLLDLGGRLAEAEATLQAAMPESGPAPARMVQALASMQARQGQGAAALELVRAQLVDRAEQPVLEYALVELANGRAPPRPFDTAAGGMADALLGIAEALHQERGSARAVVYARLAAYLQPDLAEAALLIGDIMVEQDDLEAAVRAYGEVDAASPLRYAAQLRIARTLHALDRPEESYELLEELAEAEPARIESLVQLGDLLRRDEHYQRAEAAYSRAVERLGEPERENWTLFYARGITFERTKRWPQAESDFRTALELEPEQPFVLNYLGYSWVDMGMNLDQAKGMLYRAVELRPNDGFIIDSLGWVHYRLGEYPDAVEQLERAVELEPGDPVINDHLGDAYWRVGRHREARYQWERALTLEPEEEAVADIEEKLKSGLPGSERNRS